MANDPRYPEKYYVNSKVAAEWRNNSGQWNPSLYNDKEPESFEMFSDDPLQFEDIAFMVWGSMRDIYRMTQYNNRFSVDYKKNCIKFGEIVRESARCCLTKTVLEQKGIQFPKLKELSIEYLYRAVSFNFRKTYASIQERKMLRGSIDIAMLSLVSDWYELLDRLKATEEKIQLLREGKLKADRLIACAVLFPKKQLPERNDHSASKEPPAVSKEPQPVAQKHAFPIMGTAIRDEMEKLRTNDPEAVPQKQPEAAPSNKKSDSAPYPYETMKQRKKAERLARKQARQESNTPKANPAGSPRTGTTKESHSAAAELDKLCDEFERNLLLHPETAIPMPEFPLPIRTFLPERV